MLSMPKSRNVVEYPVSVPWRLKKVLGRLFWQLSHFRPFSNIFKVAANVLGVEIDKCIGRLGSGWPIPDLSEHSNIDCAHELLSDNVQTVRNMLPEDELLVLEGTLALFPVIVHVVVQSLSHQVCAVQLVKSFYVGRISAAVLLTDPDLLVWREPGLGSPIFWYRNASIWKKLSVYFHFIYHQCDVQFIPRASQAASTSGLASWR